MKSDTLKERQALDAMTPQERLLKAAREVVSSEILRCGRMEISLISLARLKRAVAAVDKHSADAYNKVCAEAFRKATTDYHRTMRALANESWD